MMASSIALALSCSASFIAFRRSSRQAQQSADFDVGLGPELAVERDIGLLGGKSSPVAAR
jgi:hypothetical protein